MVVFGCACGNQETTDSNKEKASQETTVESNKSKDAPKENSNHAKDLIEPDFCACLEHTTPEKCLEMYKGQSISSSELKEIECYGDHVYKKEAQALCDCINKLQQVSLKCDELQRRLDETYDSLEQTRISDYFKSLDCE